MRRGLACALAAACWLAAPTLRAQPAEDDERTAAPPVPADEAPEPSGPNEAGGDDEEEEGEAEAQEGGVGEATTVPPRPIPDYGRPPSPPDAWEDLLWVPRVLFYPLHLVLEYGVRYPLGWLLETIEMTGIDQNLAPGREADEAWHWWFRPYGRYDHGLAPSLGLDLYARQKPSSTLLGVGVDFWGLDRLGGWLGLRLIEERTRVRLVFRGGYRADGVYGGLGWDSDEETAARFARGRGEARIEVIQRLWRRSELTAGARLSVERFFSSGWGRRSHAENEAVMRDVPGFTDGYTPIVLFTRMALDSREPEKRGHGTGLRVELGGGWGVDGERGAGASWARAGGVAELAVELRRDRTLALRSLVEISEPLGNVPIPFTELVWLGGTWDRLPGFLEGQLVGQSAATLGLRYRYAVWSWVDAVLFYDVGNVFGSGFEDFDVERLRMSFGFALRARDARDFSVMIAAGTAPFVEGADVTSVRFAFGIATEP